MLKLLRNDWLKIIVMIFSIGIAAERSNSANQQMTAQGPRIEQLERASIEHTEAIRQQAEFLQSAALTIERVNVELQNHRLLDASDTARIEQALEEIDRLRDHQ